MNDDIEAIIARNEERRRVKAKIPPGRWFVDPDGDVMTEYGAVVCLLDSEAYHHRMATPVGPFIAHARNDTPEDDIDQLLALIADLQAALQEH